MVIWSTASKEIQDAAALCLPRIYYEILNVLYSGDNIFSVLWHMCGVLLLLPHMSHYFQNKICSWTLAEGPCQKQWMCLYNFKHQVLASWRESFCCCLVFSKGTGNHPSAKQQITSVSLHHIHSWKLKKIHLGKQGWIVPRSGKEAILFISLIFLIVKWSISPPGHGTHYMALASIAAHTHLCLWGSHDYLTLWSISQTSHHRRWSRKQ